MKEENKMVWMLLGVGILLFVSLFFVRSAQASWYNSAWSCRRKITIDHTKVSNKNQSNSPVLISLKDADLKFTANGGRVAQSQGEDILFTSPDGKTKLYYEIEKYDPETGELKVWVRVPTLSHIIDTVLYLYYGNSACGSQQNKNGVWDSNYKMVLHLNENAGVHFDSSPNKNNGMPKNRINQNGAGKINGADDFDGSSDYIKALHSHSLNITDKITVGAWVNSKSPKAEVLQTIVSKWSPLTTFNTFDAYDAGNTSGLEMGGFLGAVFDGRYVYFVPQCDGKGQRHGKVLRYDTQGDFRDKKNWSGYNAESTSGLNIKGYYGALLSQRKLRFTKVL